LDKLTDIEIKERIGHLIEQLLRKETEFLAFSLKLLREDPRILKEISRQISEHNLIKQEMKNSFIFLERDY